jgi:curved DNA-binding protein CbpA
MAKSYYEILDISADAEAPEIRRAYRNVLRKYHPDLNPNQRKAAKRSRQLNAALGVLTNPAERARYDAKLERIEKREKKAKEKSKRRNSRQNTRSTEGETNTKQKPKQKQKPSSRNRTNRQPGPRPGFKQRSAKSSTRHSSGKKRQQPEVPKWKKKRARKRPAKKSPAYRWSRPAKTFKHTPKPELGFQHGLGIGIFVGTVLIILLLALLVLLGMIEFKLIGFFA